MKFLASIALAFWTLGQAQTASSETQYLLPDSYQLNALSDQSAVKLTKTATGYQAVLSFKPRYDSARNFLKANYGAEYDNLDIVELPVHAQGFRYLDESTLGSLILKKVDSQYFGPELRVNIEFTSELAYEQLQKIISFNLVYGLVDATVVCSGSTFHELCDQALPSLSALNQYQLGAMNPVRSRQSEDYLNLTGYRNRLAMEQRVPSATKTILDALASDELLGEDGTCKVNLNSYRAGVCRAIQQLSPMKKSLIDSITQLARQIYPQALDDTALRNIVVNQSLLGINEVVFPPEGSPESHGASIGNHESVNLKMYKTLNDGPIVEISYSGFVAYKTWKYVYKVNRRSIVYTEGTPEGPITTALGPNDVRFSEFLRKIRDYVAYISAPERFTWGDLYDASILVPSLRTLIAYLDTQITKAGLLVPNCVVYDHPSSVYQGQSWTMTGGPIGDLGPWNDRATFVWVRSGYRMVVTPLPNFDKTEGFWTYSGMSSSEGAIESAGGYLFNLQGSPYYKSISTAICLPQL